MGKRVSADEFVEAWQRSASIEEVSERLGLPAPVLHARASEYRSKGVRLKSMRRNKLHVDELNAIIDRMGGGEPSRPQGPVGLSEEEVKRTIREILASLGR